MQLVQKLPEVRSAPELARTARELAGQLLAHEVDALSNVTQCCEFSTPTPTMDGPEGADGARQGMGGKGIRDGK